MKNITTLSLITVAILGLNGCGEESTLTNSNSNNTQKVNAIQKLSDASTKHSKSDWIAIENGIQNLDNTEGFNTMLLNSIEKNVATLTYVGIDKEMAYATNSDAMFDDLTDLDIGDLDNQVVAECKEDESCKEMAYASLDTAVLIDKEMAYAIATDIRKDKEKPSTMDGLLKEFTCDAGLVRKVKFYGVEDNFSTANGDENATASQQVQTNPGVVAYFNNIGLSNYDTTQVNRQFAEEVKNLPINITKAKFYMGLQNHGSNDRLTIGNMDTNTSTLDFFGEDVLKLTTDFNWNKNGSVYSQNFDNIILRDNTTLKDYAQTHNNFDVYVQDDTYVDFIAVATCSKPNPIKEVTNIVNKFECSENEKLVKIMGGEIDAFSPTTDTNPINPSATLANFRDTATVYPGVDVSYDYTAYDHHFIDTLTLPTGYITKAEFNIGYKVIGSSLASNDAIYIGEYGTNHAGGHLYDNFFPIVPQGWNVNDITNYGHVAQVDLAILNNNTAGATNTVFDTMKNNGFLDVYVQDDTAVDFTQLNLCIGTKP
jgi:hypothetical protein